MRIIIAGGGTGGHLYPGIALAETFVRLQNKTQILFIGTTQGIGTSPIPKKGFDLETVAATGFVGKGLSGKLKSLFSIPKGLGQSLGILKKFKPQLVIGIGGYVAVPVMLAATLLRIKRVILEPNVMPGLVNKITAPLSHLVITTFEASNQHLPRHKIKRLGIPVRPEILRAKDSQKSKGTATLVILGGSQGAHSINQAMIEALPFLKKAPQSFSIIHQTGKTDSEDVKTAYRKSGLEAKVSAFIDDMATTYSRADLIISRAGAGTLSEIAALGKAALMIPFPYAAGHQIENAKAFVEIGAAEMILDQDLSGEALAKAILALIVHPARLKKMEKAALQHGNVNAAEDIVKMCIGLIEGSA
ncbi:UDP-N-acetylglucosamine--N-acetylmuramyl-(pentapeptide) pyrophosphoryl-undecaprenol N-acetylglucosamine transferase [hydrothermal vent metagenome]|uniref:UDP-N-acetylglucosamine--N-acetylmuramyl-(Pentapeptide) pyrophosphoryl-undecaprenol N-acetylglucosamine transferase n=1 Tax=hydrothermal vent metagenome TaxID=652676 RepID=A0A3B1CQG8_9ZZZZ